MKNVSKDYLTHLKIDYNVDKLILESELIDFNPLRIKSKKAKGRNKYGLIVSASETRKIKAQLPHV